MVLLLVAAAAAASGATPGGGLRWLTAYGADYANADAVHTWANVLMPVGNQGDPAQLPAVAATHERYGLPSLWHSPVYHILAPPSGSERGSGKLLPNWGAITKQRLAPVLPFIKNKTVSGIFVGDELLVGANMTAENFAAFVTLLRQVVGPDAILYANEGWGTIGADGSSARRFWPSGLRQIPPELDYISEDIYAYAGECSCGTGPCGTKLCAGNGEVCEVDSRTCNASDPAAHCPLGHLCPGWNTSAEVRTVGDTVIQRCHVALHREHQSSQCYPKPA
jgi:hypothetical protein